MKTSYLLKSCAAASLAVALSLTACTPPAAPGPGGAPSTEKAAKGVTVDGSNTVYPITASLQELMGSDKGDITIGHSGTGAGFQKFINGEIDVCDASRVIKKEEADKLKEKGIEFYEIALAYDGLCVVVNAKNNLTSVTKEELNALWNKDSKVKKWNEVNKAWPDKEIKLYGPTSEHGTYEYFNEAINGDKKNTRSDYSQQADYDALVTNVSRDENALAYIGHSYASLKKGEVKILKVDGGKGPVEPTEATIMDLSYTPLSRTLLIYVNKKSYDQNPGVKAFVTAALDKTKIKQAVKDANYVALPDDSYDLGAKLVAAGKTGSHLMDAKPGTTYAEAVTAALK